MSELKPCPFCGSHAHVHEDQRFLAKKYNFPKWYIVCYGCGIRTPTVTMEQAVKFWNRRVSDG